MALYNSKFGGPCPQMAHNLNRYKEDDRGRGEGFYQIQLWGSEGVWHMKRVGFEEGFEERQRKNPDYLRVPNIRGSKREKNEGARELWVAESTKV